MMDSVQTPEPVPQHPADAAAAAPAAGPADAPGELSSTVTKETLVAPAEVNGTYCPRCGTLVPFDQLICPGCRHDIEHNPSKIQRYGLLGGLGFIFLGGVFVFTQPKAYHTFRQDLWEIFIILSVVGAGVCFFAAVVDMVRRGGE